MKKTIAGALLAGTVAAIGLATGVAQADTFAAADIPAPIFTPPPPPPPRPPHPFCTPRGGLFIVGPICDEIGVH